MNVTLRKLPGRLPRLCLLCQLDTPSAFCSDCHDALPFIDQACQSCALPIIHFGRPNTAPKLCPECQEEPPPFNRTIAPLAFAYPVNHLVARFKDFQDLAIGDALTRLAIDYCRAARPILSVDAVCAVPSLGSRRFSRGFNPAEFIAKRVSAHVKQPLLPIIHKIRQTHDQRGLSRIERYGNIQDAFRIEPCLLSQVRHLLLVDDVITTGATARHLSELLLKNGVETVTLVALARTPKAAT